MVFFSIWSHHKCLCQLLPLHLNTYVMGLRLLQIFYIFSEGIVFRRRNQTSVDVRFWRLKSVLALKGLSPLTAYWLIEDEENLAASSLLNKKWRLRRSLGIGSDSYTCHDGMCIYLCSITRLRSYQLTGFITGLSVYGRLWRHHYS